jgi:hypothetical protein
MKPPGVSCPAPCSDTCGHLSAASTGSRRHSRDMGAIARIERPHLDFRAARAPTRRGVARGSAVGDRLLHQVGGFIHRNVLPYSQNRPSRVREKTICLRVPLAVSRNLLSPEVSVDLRGDVVLRASVPEATVQKDGKACRGEDQIGGPPYCSHRPSVHEVSKALCVHCSSQRQFRTRVASAVAPHRRAHCRRGCP